MDLSRVILASSRLKLESFQRNDAAEAFAAMCASCARIVAHTPALA